MYRCDSHFGNFRRLIRSYFFNFCQTQLERTHAFARIAKSNRFDACANVEMESFPPTPSASRPVQVEREPSQSSRALLARAINRSLTTEYAVKVSRTGTRLSEAFAHVCGPPPSRNQRLQPGAEYLIDNESD